MGNLFEIKHWLLLSENWQFSLVASCIVLQFPMTAMAESYQVELSGTLEESCTFRILENGLLGFFPEENSDRISSQEGNGSAAKVEINCNSEATLEVSSPRQTEGPNVDGEATALITLENDTVASGGGVLTVAPNGKQEILVDLEIDSNHPLEAGTYTYTVTLTATP